MAIPIKFLSNQEKEKLLRQLNSQFGIKELPWIVGKLGKERIILFSGDLSEKEILRMDEFGRVEGVGLYFAKEMPDGIRLSIEGTQLLKDQINKNIFELNEKQSEEWMLGQEIPVQIKEKGFMIMKFKDDFLGTGKASEGRITNFVPKPRRLKFKEAKVQEETIDPINE